MTLDGERDLIRAAQAGDSRAAAALVKSQEGMVRVIASSFFGHSLREDLFAEGMMGVVIALKRFDLARPVLFGTYARWWAFKMVMIAFKKHQQWHRAEEAARDTATEEAGDAVSEDTARRRETHALSSTLLARLPAGERRLIELYYGLAGNRPHSLPKAAAKLGIKTAAADWLWKKALRRLKIATGLLPAREVRKRKREVA